MDAREQLRRAKENLRYLKSVLSSPKIERWVQKEYEALEKDCIEEITKLEQHIADNPDVFNEPQGEEKEIKF